MYYFRRKFLLRRFPHQTYSSVSDDTFTGPGPYPTFPCACCYTSTFSFSAKTLLKPVHPGSTSSVSTPSSTQSLGFCPHLPTLATFTKVISGFSMLPNLTDISPQLY